MPCTSTVVVPSGMRSTRPISTAVPIWYRSARSSASGSTSLACSRRPTTSSGRLDRFGGLDGQRGPVAAEEQGRDQVREDHRLGQRQDGVLVALVRIQVLHAAAGASSRCRPVCAAPTFARATRRVRSGRADVASRSRCVDATGLRRFPVVDAAVQRIMPPRGPGGGSQSGTVSPAVSSCHTQSSAANASGCRCGPLTPRLRDDEDRTGDADQVSAAGPRQRLAQRGDQVGLHADRRACC